MLPNQKRLKCYDCNREFSHVWRGNSSTAPQEGHCPACNSLHIEEVEFKGLFDIKTPSNLISMIMNPLSEAHRQESEAKRQHAITAFEQSDSPILMRLVK